MSRLAPQGFGYAFAAMGGLFVLVGGIMLLVQIGITGEWMFEVEVNGRKLDEKRPVGIEFASFFASMGSGFFFIGLAGIARSTRQRTVRYALAGASFAMVAAVAVAMVLTTATQFDVGWGVLIVWPLVLASGYALATQHASYRHGDDLDQRGQPREQHSKNSLGTNLLDERYPVGRPVDELATSGLRSSDAGTPAVEATAAAATPRITLPALKRAAIGGLLLSLFPLVFFGLFAVMAGQNAPGPGAGLFFGGFAVVAAVFAAIFGFAALLMLQVFSAYTGSTLTAAYGGFARQVGGEVVEQTIPLLGVKLPKAVVFTHRDRPAVLDIEKQGSGDSAIHYTRLTIELPQPCGFQCRISPQGMFSAFGSLLGFQDAQLGWELFDDLHVVKSADEQRVRDVIDRAVQEQLLALRSFSQQHQATQHAGSGSNDLSIEANRVQLRITGYLASEQDLADFYRLSGELYDLVESRLVQAKP